MREIDQNELELGFLTQEVFQEIWSEDDMWCDYIEGVTLCRSCVCLCVSVSVSCVSSGMEHMCHLTVHNQYIIVCIMGHHEAYVLVNIQQTQIITIVSCVWKPDLWEVSTVLVDAPPSTAIVDMSFAYSL